MERPPALVMQCITWFTPASIASKGDECKTSTLLNTIGDEGNDIYETFTFEKAGDELIFDKVMQKFELYCTPKKNITFERFHFNHCVQEKEESSDQFITRLKHLSQTCEFGVLENSLIKDRIVYGIRNDSTRENYLEKRTLPWKKLKKICRAAEMAKMQINELQVSQNQKLFILLPVPEVKELQNTKLPVNHNKSTLKQKMILT